MERVEKAMEVKHAAELSELETRLGLNVKPILVVTDSLYDFKLTPEDDKPAEASKVQSPLNLSCKNDQNV